MGIFGGWKRRWLQNFGKRRSICSKSDVQALLADLKACSITRRLEVGKKLHAQAVQCGHDCSIYVANALISMYAKCGSMVDASKVFYSVKHPTVVSWTALIMGYADNGEGITSLILFCRMKTEGPAPNFLTFVAALKACTSLAVDGRSEWEECKHKGRAIHSLVVEKECNSDIYVQNTLLDMYAKCGCMVDACRVFDNLQQPTVVSWTALISGYAANEQSHAALDFFTRMRNEGPAPNSITFVAALKACTSLAAKSANGLVECRVLGKAIHDLATKSNCNSELNLQNTLIDMYTKCGCIADAREVFDSMKQPDVVSWTGLILGYADNGQGRSALDMFTRMRTEGPAPDSVTFVAALKAFTSLAVKEGWEKFRDSVKAIHNLGAQDVRCSDIYVQSLLIDMYVKCGKMVDAREVFDSVKYPNVISWNVLILGYADNGQGHNALDLFTKMKIQGPSPDSVTFMAVFKACGLAGALDFGRAVHSEIECRKELDVVLVNCLVDFYSKCGSLVEARGVFNLHAKSRNMITWNTLLAGFGSYGDTETVFEVFKEMQDAGFQPDGITFLTILTCCSHAGLVDEGKECFETMSAKFGITPNVQHYTCMIDLFGRANKIDDALALLKRMPCIPDDVTWTTILGACRRWKNMEIGRLAFQSLTELNNKVAAGYVLMGQLYDSTGEYEMMTLKKFGGLEKENLEGVG